MVKDASLFSSLDISFERKIYMVDYFFLNIDRHGGIPFKHGYIVDVYHVPSLSANILLVSQQTCTSKIVEY